MRNRINRTIEASEIMERYGGDINSCHDKKFLQKLSALGIRFNQLEDYPKKELCQMFSAASFSADRYRDLLSYMQRVPAYSLSCPQWLSLYEMCCWRGRYVLGGILREKARQLSIAPLEKPGGKPPISWRNTIAAGIEGGECCDEEALDGVLENAGIKGKDASFWRYYVAALNKSTIPQNWVKWMEDSDFSAYLEGKSIAIVGAIAGKDGDGPEIDAHDVVVRLNHSFEDKGTDKRCKGVRTNITSFNGAQGKAFLADRRGVLPAEVHWGCFKSSTVMRVVRQENRDKFVRAHTSFKDLQFHGVFNTVPIVAVDFVLCKAKSIKIFHTDLMLTLERQKGYYAERLNRPSGDHEKMRVAFRRSSIGHDPVQQYRVLNKLWQAGKVSGDSGFSYVMNMGLDGYLRELEKLYGGTEEF